MEKADPGLRTRRRRGLAPGHFFKTQISRTTVDDFYGRPMMVFRFVRRRKRPWEAADIVHFVGAFCLLLLSSPVLLLAALAVKLTSPGPVIFRQQRSGLNGRPFTM